MEENEQGGQEPESKAKPGQNQRSFPAPSQDIVVMSALGIWDSCGPVTVFADFFFFLIFSFFFYSKWKFGGTI